MYLEHFHLTHPPFSEPPNPEVFFPGSRREEVCQSLILDILAGKPLLKLVGKEGSGKSLICRLLEERLPESCRVVSLEHPVGSFEDQLRVVCLELGMVPRDPQDQREMDAALRQLLAREQARGVRVVVLIDEAEKLFLAALERLVRHVGEGSGDLQLTLVLVGRPGLESNLEQIAALNTKSVFSGSYILEDLSESETRQYLRFRASAAGMSREQFAEVFTEGAVAKIFNAAKGNLRLINILAEEALQNYCAEKSFMVLLDHVEPAAATEPAMRPSPLILIYDLLRANRRLTAALAAAMVVVLAIGVYLNRSGEQAPSTAMTTQTAPSSSPTSAFGNADPAHPLPPYEQRDGEAIFRERLGASAGWLAGMYRGGYTIQLMMLSSPTAQSSLVGTLISDEYYPLRDQLYILRKQTNPPTLFVFYGVYDRLDAAREARNSMPVFLRKHQPYPLTISEAMRKIEH